jgi:hypothetical protein
VLLAATGCASGSIGAGASRRHFTIYGEKIRNLDGKKRMYANSISSGFSSFRSPYIAAKTPAFA